MKYISLGTINKKILFSVFAGLFKFGANIFLYHSEVKMNSHPCILSVNAGLGLSLSFFPFLYLKLRDRKLNSSKSSSKIQISFIYNNEMTKKSKKKYLYILVIASLDFLQKFLTFFFSKLFLENFWIFDTCLLLIFSSLILKAKFYSHHFFSLIMMIIIGIILNVINYYESNITFWEVAVTLLTEIFYCLENVICKHTMEIKFSSPYEICFYVGLFELILFSVLLIIFTNVPLSSIEKMNHLNENYIDDIYNYLDKVDITEGFIFVLLMLLRCIFILFGFVTVDFFTPAHIVLILIVGEVSFIFFANYNWKLYLKIIFFVFLLFFVLIFTEIIELNVFGLQKNTKKNIRKRSGEDIIENDPHLSEESINTNDNDD